MRLPFIGLVTQSLSVSQMMVVVLCWGVAGDFRACALQRMGYQIMDYASLWIALLRKKHRSIPWMCQVSFHRFCFCLQVVHVQFPMNRKQDHWECIRRFSFGILFFRECSLWFFMQVIVMAVSAFSAQFRSLVSLDVSCTRSFFRVHCIDCYLFWRSWFLDILMAWIVSCCYL